MKNSFYTKFKSLTTTSDIEEEKKKRVKDLGKQDDTSTTAKDLSKVMKGNVIGDEEYEYFMKLVGGTSKD